MELNYNYNHTYIYMNIDNIIFSALVSYENDFKQIDWLFRFAIAHGCETEMNSLHASDIILQYARILGKRTEIENKYNIVTSDKMFP